MISYQDEETIISRFLEKNYTKNSIEHQIFCLLEKYKAYQMTSGSYESSLSIIQKDLKESLISENSAILKSQNQKYLKEITALSKKLAKADEIVKEKIKGYEKIKQFLSEIRIENSNLVLINRSLRQQLMNLGAKVEENEKIIKRLNSIESMKEKLDDASGRISIDSYFSNKFYSKEQAKVDELSVRFSKCNKGDEILERNLEIEYQRHMKIKIPSKIRQNSIQEKFSLKNDKKYRFLWMESQGFITIYSKSPIKELKKMPQLGISRPRNMSIKQEKIFLKVKTEKLFHVKPTESRRKVKNFKLSFSSLTVPPRFPKNEPRPIIINPEVVQRKAKTQHLQFLEVCSYHIFTNDIGRSQVEPPSISEYEESLMSLCFTMQKPEVSLSLSRTVKASFVPKKKIFITKKQFSINIAPVSLKIERYIPNNKIVLGLSASIVRKKPILKMFMFHSFSQVQPQATFEYYPGKNLRSRLNIIKGKSIDIVQLVQIDEDSDTSSVKGRRTKKTGNRGTAIEEYFTLTFQAVKLNFPDKDKIALIKSGDLYSKVQQIKLPFNFWHDWIKEQFNFIASRS